MTEIDAIKARHSVRKYLNKAIEQEKIDKLNELIDACNKEGNLHLQLLPDAGDTYKKFLSKAMGLGSAPSVIACVGPDDDTVEVRVGYYGEKGVLFAQMLGLNTCWTGMFNPKTTPAKIEEGERLIIVIAIGYGATQGKERKSKASDQVTMENKDRPYWFNYGVEMALLAPTAINQQKFEIGLNEDGSVSFIDKGGIYSKTDLGIVKYHFEVGAEFAKGKAQGSDQ